MNKTGLAKLSKSLAKSKLSLISKINAHLLKSANPYYGPDYKPKPRIKPSDLGSPCYRKIYYSYLRTDPDQKIKPDQKRIFDIGDAVHGMIGDWVLGAKLLIPYRDLKTGEIPLSKWTGKPDMEFPIVVPELDIEKGKIDAILKIDGEIWIGEWKSSKSSKFEELTAAQDEHIIQANTYVHLFEYCLQRGDYAHIEELSGITEVKGVIFLYLNKDTSELKEFIVPKMDDSLEVVVEKIAKIKEFVDKKELPGKTEHYCYFCPFNKKCKKEFNPLDEE